MMGAMTIILSPHRRSLRELRAWDADGATREVERHLEVLHFIGRVAGCGRFRQA
jgi:hypothetical protein